MVGKLKMKGIEFILLGIGALAGTFLRYKIVSSPIMLGILPVNVLLINIIGSFIIGVFSILSTTFNLDAKYSLFLAVGFCGSFTTMSAFALETINLLDNKQFTLFGLNVFGNVGLSLAAVILGRMFTLGVIRI
jgi:CrcB protein